MSIKDLKKLFHILPLPVIYEIVCICLYLLTIRARAKVDEAGATSGLRLLLRLHHNDELRLPQNTGRTVL
jgi:hypothetical protein